MLRAGRIGAVIPLLLTVLCSRAGAAWADDNLPTGTTTCTVASCKVAAVSTTVQGARPVHVSAAMPKGGDSAPVCTVEPSGALITVGNGAKGYLDRLVCGSGQTPTAADPSIPLFVVQGEAPQVAADPVVVAHQAYTELSPPRPVVVLNPASFRVVGVPTWLWLDPAEWSPQKATASVPGVTVTATATPVSVSWDLGESGQLVLCHGPGTAFTSRSNPDAASPDCGYVYRRPSSGQPDGRFTVRATIHWQVVWRARGTSQQGVFPDLVTTSALPVVVKEVQTLVVRGSNGG